MTRLDIARRLERLEERNRPPKHVHYSVPAAEGGFVWSLCSLGADCPDLAQPEPPAAQQSEAE